VGALKKSAEVADHPKGHGSGEGKNYDEKKILEGERRGSGPEGKEGKDRGKKTSSKDVGGES